MIRVVRLGAKFSPEEFQLGVGQKFRLEVDESVQATIAGVPEHCPAGSAVDVAGGLLSVQCGTGRGSYLFSGERAGSATLTATVRPRCAPGVACPQWVATARLTISIA
jgi:hypothetical protein